MDPAITTLCVLAVAAFLFVTELIPLAVTAMAACTALGILGVLPSKQVSPIPPSYFSVVCSLSAQLCSKLASLKQSALQ